MVQAEGERSASSEETENKNLGENSPRSTRRKSPANVISPALDSNSLEEEIKESLATEIIKSRPLRRRSSAVEKPPALVSKPMEESSKNEDLKVLSPRSLRRRSQVEEKSSAKKAQRMKI